MSGGGGGGGGGGGMEKMEREKKGRKKWKGKLIVYVARYVVHPILLQVRTSSYLKSRAF